MWQGGCSHYAVQSCNGMHVHIARQGEQIKVDTFLRSRVENRKCDAQLSFLVTTALRPEEERSHSHPSMNLGAGEEYSQEQELRTFSIKQELSLSAPLGRVWWARPCELGRGESKLQKLHCHGRTL